MTSAASRKQAASLENSLGPRLSGALASKSIPNISGARPHISYALVAFNCAGSSGYQTWAAGATNAHGSGTLSGREGW